MRLWTIDFDEKVFLWNTLVDSIRNSCDVLMIGLVAGEEEGGEEEEEGGEGGEKRL